MPSNEDRRQFLKVGSLAAAGGLLAGAASAQQPMDMKDMPMPQGHAGHSDKPQPKVPADSDVEADARIS